MTSKSPIAAAIEQLQLERENLTARLAKVDDLIFRMRDVFHLPAAKRSTRQTKVTDASNESGHGALSAAAIKALAAGPMRVREAETKLALTRHQLGQLVKRGVLVATGKTAARRIMLPSHKEPP